MMNRVGCEAWRRNARRLTLLKMSLRGRCLSGTAKDVMMRSKKRSLASRAEERALEWREQAPGAGPAMAELAHLLGVQNPQESMLRVTESLERSTKLFRNSPDFAIPEVRFSQIEDGRFPYYVTRQVKRRGVLVVRGVVPSDVALRWQDSLLEYLETNGVSGPPGARDVFWSRAQAQARENLGVRQVLAALNRLWKPDPSTPVDLTKSLSFCDRAFVGNPTSSSLMGRHAAVMAGGPGASQRWLSPHHSQAYRDIFEGRWEDWDPFMAGPRMRAAEASSSSSWAGDDSASTPGGLVGGVPGGGETPQPFRPFQGYLSFGRWGEVGNVHVVPTMKAATAFTLLRPFMDDAFEADTADADWLCGAGQGQELPLSPKWHQPILDALVRLPPLLPGDAVFWHADTIHCDADAVVPHEGGGGEGVFVRGGTGDSSGARGDRLATPKFGGVHLSSLPVCEANSTYVKAQREAFADGAHPPAFSPVGGDGGEGEGGFVARASREELTREGRRAMGLRRYTKEHYNPALEAHHRLLEIAYKW